MDATTTYPEGRETWRVFYAIVLRESWKRRHLDVAYRRSVRWAIERLRATA